VASGTPGDVVSPGHLRAAFGIRAAVSRTDAGAPFVVRHLDDADEEGDLE
jgi:hypothetical protein